MCTLYIFIIIFFRIFSLPDKLPSIDFTTYTKRIKSDHGKKILELAKQQVFLFICNWNFQNCQALRGIACTVCGSGRVELFINHYFILCDMFQ